MVTPSDNQNKESWISWAKNTAQSYASDALESAIEVVESSQAASVASDAYQEISDVLNLNENLQTVAKGVQYFSESAKEKLVEAIQTTQTKLNNTIEDVSNIKSGITEIIIVVGNNFLENLWNKNKTWTGLATDVMEIGAEEVYEQIAKHSETAKRILEWVPDVVEDYFGIKIEEAQTNPNQTRIENNNLIVADNKQAPQVADVLEKEISNLSFIKKTLATYLDETQKLQTENNQLSKPEAEGSELVFEEIIESPKPCDAQKTGCDSTDQIIVVSNETDGKEILEVSEQITFSDIISEIVVQPDYQNFINEYVSNVTEQIIFGFTEVFDFSSLSEKHLKNLKTLIVDARIFNDDNLRENSDEKEVLAQNSESKNISDVGIKKTLVQVDKKIQKSNSDSRKSQVALGEIENSDKALKDSDQIASNQTRQIDAVESIPAGQMAAMQFMISRNSEISNQRKNSATISHLQNENFIGKATDKEGDSDERGRDRSLENLALIS